MDPRVARAALQSPSCALAVLLPERFRAGCAFGGKWGHSPVRERARPLSGQALRWVADVNPVAGPGPPRRSCHGELANEPACAEHRRSSWLRAIGDPAACPARSVPVRHARAVRLYYMQSTGARGGRAHRASPGRAGQRRGRIARALRRRVGARPAREPDARHPEGDRRFDDSLAGSTPAALEQSSPRRPGGAGEAWQASTRAHLSAADQLNRELFQRLYEAAWRHTSSERSTCRWRNASGLASAHQLAEVDRFRSARDYDAWLQRMRTFDSQVDQDIALLRAGHASADWCQPQMIIQRVPAQIEKQIVNDRDAEPVLRRVHGHASCDCPRRAGSGCRRLPRGRSGPRSCRPMCG